MSDLSKYTCLRQGVTNVYIDQKLALGTIKVNCPTFWKNKLPGEKKTIHRGHLIVEYDQEFTNGKQHVVSIHVYDCRLNVIRSWGSSSDNKSLDDAKAKIDHRIDHPDEEPLQSTEEDVEVTITVKVTVSGFRDTEGFLTNGTVIDWDLPVPNDKVGEHLKSIISNKALDSLR